MLRRLLLAAIGTYAVNKFLSAYRKKTEPAKNQNIKSPSQFL